MRVIVWFFVGVIIYMYEFYMLFLNTYNANLAILYWSLKIPRLWPKKMYKTENIIIGKYLNV